jgi:hypothetical protein
VPPARKIPERLAPKLGPFKSAIDGMLREDLTAPRKQRHTATRIWNRLDNVLMDAQDEPVAVIDWELATLGDPLTDLALMIVYGRIDERLGGTADVPDASLAAGISLRPR